MQRIFKIILFSVLLFPLASSAQGNFKEGYIINLKGDTIKGFVEQHAWDENPKTVTFKTDLEKPENSKLSIADIKQFGIDGSVTFIKSVCRISLATVAENHLFPKDTVTRIDTVFLELLQKGKNISLYQYTDDYKTRYYYAENNGTPQELIYRVYLNATYPSINSPRTITEKIFIQQFSTLALKYNVFDDKLQKILGNVEYKESDILKLSSITNNVSAPAPVKRKQSFVKLVLAIIMMGAVTYAVYHH
jgi:hypothetical protein